MIIICLYNWFLKNHYFWHQSMTNIIWGETPLISPSTTWKLPGPSIPDQSDRQLLAQTKRYPFWRPAGSLSQVLMRVPGLCFAVKIPAATLTWVEASPFQKPKCKQAICLSTSHSFRVRQVYLKPGRPGGVWGLANHRACRSPAPWLTSPQVRVKVCWGRVMFPTK